MKGQELKVMQGGGQGGFRSQKKKDRSSRLWWCAQRVLEQEDGGQDGVGVLARKMEAEFKAKTTTTWDNKFN